MRVQNASTANLSQQHLKGLSTEMCFGVEKSFVICDLKIAYEKSGTKDAQKYVTRLSLPARRSLSWSSPAFSKPLCLMLPLSRTRLISLLHASLCETHRPSLAVYPNEVEKNHHQQPSNSNCCSVVRWEPRATGRHSAYQDQSCNGLRIQ